MNDKIQKIVLICCHSALAALFVAGGIQAFETGASVAAIACVIGIFFMVAAVFQDITEK